MVPVPTIPRRLRRLLAAPAAAAAAVPDADRYRKHFSAAAHLWFLLWHGLSASPSLRQSHSIALGEPDFWPRLGLPPSGISRSQLARSTHSRPLACFETLLARLRGMVTAPTRDAPIHIVDSSFVGLSATLCPWSQHGDHAPGVRLHTGFDLATAIPSHLVVSGAETPDITAWRERDWAELRGWTVLMDGGYYSHQDFAQLREHRVSWVCPLNAQARVEVTTAHGGPWPPTAAGDIILADQTITLGSPNNRNGAVLPGLRLVTSQNRDGAVHRTVTDRFDLTATAVVALYRRRWQIELFFRFLKHQLGGLRPLGTSRQAVELTVLLAVIVAILAVLLAEARPKHIPDIGWVRLLGRAVERLILRGG
jgi:Transposase DDE domain